ncbi:hypothetical protein MPER_16295, partial [Moniliophthora perniciosa FA553]
MIASYGLPSPDRLKVVEARRRKQNGKTIRRFNAFIDSESSVSDTVGYIEYRYWEKQEKEEEGSDIKREKRSRKIWNEDSDEEGSEDEEDQEEDEDDYVGGSPKKANLGQKARRRANN